MFQSLVISPSSYCHCSGLSLLSCPRKLEWFANGESPFSASLLRPVLISSLNGVSPHSAIFSKHQFHLVPPCWDTPVASGWPDDKGPPVDDGLASTCLSSLPKGLLSCLTSGTTIIPQAQLPSEPTWYLNSLSRNNLSYALALLLVTTLQISFRSPPRGLWLCCLRPTPCCPLLRTTDHSGHWLFTGQDPQLPCSSCFIIHPDQSLDLRIKCCKFGQITGILWSTS